MRGKKALNSQLNKIANNDLIKGICVQHTRMAKQDSLRTSNLLIKGGFNPTGNPTNRINFGEFMDRCWTFKSCKAWLISLTKDESKLVIGRCWWCLKTTINLMVCKSLRMSEIFSSSMPLDLMASSDE